MLLNNQKTRFNMQPNKVCTKVDSAKIQKYLKTGKSLVETLQLLQNLEGTFQRGIVNFL
jgi:hypothetical protein